MATTTASPRLTANRLTTPLIPLAAVGLIIAVGIAVALQFPDGTPLEAAVASGILAVAAWMLFSERYELTLAMLMLYLGLADGYLKLSTGSDQITLVRDLLLYAIVVGALVRVALRGDRLSLPPLKAWIIAWLVVVAVQVFNPSNGTWLHSIASTRQHIEWIPLFFFGYLIMRSKHRVKGFLLLLVAIAAVNGVVGFIQFNLTPDQLASWGSGYKSAIEGTGSLSARIFTDSTGVDRTRPFGLGGDFGFAGVVGLIALPAAIGLLSLPRKAGLRLASGILATGVILAIASSNARVAVVGSVVAVLAFAVLTVTSRAGLRIVLALSITAAVAYGTVGILWADADRGSFERYSSISSPSEAISTTIDYRRDTLAVIPIYAERFPLGAGIGSNGPAGSFAGGPTKYGHLNAESQPTFMLIELGIPGLIVIVGFTLTLFFLAITRIRRINDRELRILLTAIAAPLFALTSTWIVGVTTANVPGAPYLWFSAGTLAYWLLGPGWESAVRSGRARAIDTDSAHTA